VSRHGGGGHGSEWVSFSDLMAGTVAVVIMLFIVASMNAAKSAEARVAEQRVNNENLNRALTRAGDCQTNLDRAREERQQRESPIRARLEALRRALQVRGEHALGIDLDHLRITLADPDDRPTFATSSACISDSRRAAIEAVAETVRDILHGSNGTIQIEGHTDSARYPSQPRDRDQCLVTGDNFILSAQRALEVRRTLVEIGRLSGYENRIVLAAYGDTRPRYPENPRDRRNRRIEIEVRWDAATPARPAGAGAGSQ